jgi:hypothetical protein
MMTITRQNEETYSKAVICGLIIGLGVIGLLVCVGWWLDYSGTASPADGAWMFLELFGSGIIVALGIALFSTI